VVGLRIDKQHGGEKKDGKKRDYTRQTRLLTRTRNPVIEAYDFLKKKRADRRGSLVSKGRTESPTQKGDE